MSVVCRSRAEWRVEDFDLVQAVCMDMSGIPRGKLIPREVARNAIVNKKGLEQFLYLHCVGHACDLPLGVSEIMESNFDNGVWTPIMKTLVELPWASGPGRRVGQVIGHMLQENGQTEATTIRYQIERKLKKLETMGYTMTSSFTCQFTAFKSGTEFQQFLGPDNPHETTPYSALGVEELMFDTCSLLQQAGIEVDSWRRRQGRGAFEMSISPSEGVQAVDMAARLKHGVQAVMNTKGYHATFMTRPRPTNADTSSTFTYRFTIRSADGTCGFYDANKLDKLSDLGRHWLAGMIIHGSGITALCRPTVNCYHPGSPNKNDFTQTPQKLDWAIDSPSTFLSVRVTGNDLWLETRMPSSASNPYLVMLATLAAGLDGADKKMTCSRKGSPDATPVPRSLAEALNALAEDEVLEEAMSPLLLKAFLSLKREGEIKKFTEAEQGEDKEEKLRNLEMSLYLTRL